MTILAELLWQSVVEGARFSMIAMAFALTLSISPKIDLLLAVPCLLGAYGVAVLGTVPGSLLFLVLLWLGIAVVGGGAGWLLFTPNGDERISGSVRLLLSVALLLVGENLASLLIGDQQIPLGGVPWLGRGAVVGTAFLAWLGLFLALRHTRWGHLVAAVRSDPVLAVASGIQVRRLSFFVFGVAFVLAGIGGVLTGIDAAVTPRFAFPYLLMGIIAAILGGLKNVGGAFVAAFGVAGLRTLIAWYLGAQWADLLAFLLLMALALGSRARPLILSFRQSRKNISHSTG